MSLSERGSFPSLAVLKRMLGNDLSKVLQVADGGQEAGKIEWCVLSGPIRKFYDFLKEVELLLTLRTTKAARLGNFKYFERKQIPRIALYSCCMETGKGHKVFSSYLDLEAENSLWETASICPGLVLGLSCKAGLSLTALMFSQHSSMSISAHQHSSSQKGTWPQDPPSCMQLSELICADKEEVGQGMAQGNVSLSHCCHYTSGGPL